MAAGRQCYFKSIGLVVHTRADMRCFSEGVWLTALATAWQPNLFSQSKMSSDESALLVHIISLDSTAALLLAINRHSVSSIHRCYVVLPTRQGIITVTIQRFDQQIS
uniref:Uncharacterized protein n=1 Tax=Setaria digitata TaxID=48799 RepID=A0A915PYQ5_9BILA